MPKAQRSSPEAIEAACVQRLMELEESIIALQEEKLIVQRLLFKARKEKVVKDDVTRRNSFSRILIENQILEVLGNKGESRGLYELYHYARSVDNNLKGSTFRSHIYRMKEKGLIEPSQRRGYWKAVPLKIAGQAKMPTKESS